MGTYQVLTRQPLPVRVNATCRKKKGEKEKENIPPGRSLNTSSLLRAKVSAGIPYETRGGLSDLSPDVCCDATSVSPDDGAGPGVLFLDGADVPVTCAQGAFFFMA